MRKYMRNDPEHEALPIKAIAKFVRKVCPNQVLTVPTPPTSSRLLCGIPKALGRSRLEVGISARAELICLSSQRGWCQDYNSAFRVPSIHAQTQNFYQRP